MNLQARLRRNIQVGMAIVSFAVMGLMANGCQAAQPKSQPKVSASKPASVIAADSTKIAPQTSEKIIVYYFLGNARCPTCFKLESFAKSEIETDFADAIKSGKLEWKTVNVENKGNEHFNNDYKLYTKSIIVSIQKDNKESSWKNLDKIWQIVQDESKYRQYIKNEVKACLDGKCL